MPVFIRSDPNENCRKVTQCNYELVNPEKRQTKIAADDILIFYFYLSKKIRLDLSSESSARQRIHLHRKSWIHVKYQVLFSLKSNEKNIYECRLLQS